jgi:gamma-glutamyltranspeptidase/glutathione hydrolase
VTNRGNHITQPLFETTGRGPATGRDGLVAAGHPLAAAAGLHALRSGGNAFDAAVTMAAVIAVVEPSSNHVGGDVFTIFQAAGADRLTAINASGPAPAAADPAAFPDGIPAIGLRSAAVPGAVSAWETLANAHCRFDLPQLLQPAIDYAASGFPISHALSRAITDSRTKLGSSATGLELFFPAGQPLQPGAILVQEDLAGTLRAVAEGGADAFYRGEYAAKLDAWSRANDGWLTAADLAGYECETLEPIYSDYRGYCIAGQPPVSQGYVVLGELNIAAGYDLAASGFGATDTVHTMIEAKKLAFADRHSNLGDPEHVDFDIERLLSAEFAEQRRAQIDPDRAAHEPPPGDVNAGSDTTVLAAVDAEGNAITFIQSLFEGFGCGVIVDGTGVVLNNRMTGFSLDPAAPNYLQPGKRTMHTLNTYMVLRDGRPWLLGGTPGGHYQVQTNFQVISNVIDHGMNVQQAVEAPRWGHDELTDVVGIETRFPSGLDVALRGRGHVVVSDGAWGNPSRAHLIAIDPDTGAFSGGTDPRWHGQTLGY